MHIIKPHQARLTLLHRSGEKTIFASKSEAFNTLGRYFITTLQEDFRAPYLNALGLLNDIGHLTSRGCDYVMRDEFDRSLTCKDFQTLIDADRDMSGRLFSLPWGFYTGIGPVPHTGRRHGHRGTYYRRPGTQAERRQNQTIDNDEPRPRNSRSLSQISSYWDDEKRSDRYDRNWKRFRGNQYKA